MCLLVPAGICSDLKRPVDLWYNPRHLVFKSLTACWRIRQQVALLAFFFHTRSLPFTSASSAYPYILGFPQPTNILPPCIPHEIWACGVRGRFGSLFPSTELASNDNRSKLCQMALFQRRISTFATNILQIDIANKRAPLCPPSSLPSGRPNSTILAPLFPE